MMNGKISKQTESPGRQLPECLGMPLVQVLLIEDDVVDAAIVTRTLSQFTPGFYGITHCSKLTDAIELLRKRRVDAILLDVNLADSQGVRSIERIQRCNPEVPIICISGCSDERAAFEMIEAGAQDYLDKGEMNAGQIARVIRYSMYRKHVQESLRLEAQRDLLTGLPNRRLFEDRLLHAVSRATRSHSGVAVMFIDVDHFKSVNDTFGHTVGDALLCAVSQRLQRSVRESDTVARFGGDEFTVLIEGVLECRDAVIVAEKIISAINQPFTIASTEVTTSTSIGIALMPEAGVTTESLLLNADAAMYQAKQEGRNNYRLYTEMFLNAQFPSQGELFH